MIQNKKTQSLFLCSVFLILLSSVAFSMTLIPLETSPPLVPGLQEGGTFFIPGQGFQTFRFTGCDACPSMDALETRQDISNYADENLSVVTLGATKEDQRLPVEDATIFVKVIYGEGGSNYCRAVTDSVGEADFVYEEAPYSTCFEQGCTVRFTFCCPNLTEGSCLIKDCLGEPSISAYNDGIPPCPGYESMEGSWPLEATVDGQFYSLVPSIEEFLIPIPIADPLAGFSFGFCFPILVIFSLLAAAMFASGRNPFNAFSFYTPRFKRGTEKMIRGRGTVWNINSMVNTLMSTATAASRDSKAGKVQGVEFSRMKRLGKIGKKGKTKMAVGEGKKKKMATTGGKDGIAVEMGGMEEGGFAKALGTTGAMAQQSWAKGAGGVKGAFQAAGFVTAGFVGGMGLAMMQKMSYRFMPLTVVIAGGFGFNGLVGVIAESINTSEGGTRAVVESLADDLKAIGYREDPKDPNTIHFNDRDGNPQTMTFANTEEGQKRKAEKVKDLIGGPNISLAIASAAHAAAVNENATEKATDVTEVQLKNAQKGEGVIGEHVNSVVAKYDTDGKEGISAKEFQAAMKKAKPEEMGALILAAPEKAIQDLPKAYVAYMKGKIESGEFSAKDYAEAALVLAKAEAAGVEFRDVRGFGADVAQREDISKGAKAEVEAGKMTEAEAVSAHRSALAEKEYYDAVMKGTVDTDMGDLANALSNAQASMNNPDPKVKPMIQVGEGDQALLAIGASACAAAGGGDGLKDSNAGSNLNYSGFVALNDLSNAPESKEPSKEFNEVMQGYGDRTDSGHPGNYVAAKEKQGMAAEAVQELVMYGAERGASYSEFDQMAMKGGFLSSENEQKVKAMMRGELPTMYDNAWAATATSEDITKAKEDIKSGKMAPDEQAKLELRVGIAESATKKAEAHKELQAPLTHHVLVENALTSPEYENAYKEATLNVAKKIMDKKLDQGSFESEVSKQMEAKGFGNYGKTVTYVESQVHDTLNDKAKLNAAVGEYLSGGKPPGFADSEKLKKFDVISTDPQERRITELKQQQAAEVAARPALDSEIAETNQKRRTYSAVASEWAAGPGDEIYANKKHLNYADEQRQIKQEQDFKQKVAFGIAREWAGENKDKILKTFDTEDQLQKYMDQRPDLKAAQEEYKSGTPTWGDRFVHDLPSNKYDRYKDWKERYGGDQGSYGDFVKYEQDNNRMKVGDAREARKEVEDLKQWKGKYAAEEPQLGKYGTKLAKAIGVETETKKTDTRTQEQVRKDVDKRVEAARKEEAQKEARQMQKFEEKVVKPTEKARAKRQKQQQKAIIATQKSRAKEQERQEKAARKQIEVAQKAERKSADERKKELARFKASAKKRREETAARKKAEEAARKKKA